MTGSREIKFNSFTITGILKTSIINRNPKMSQQQIQVVTQFKSENTQIFIIHLLQTGKKMALRHWNSSSTLISNLYFSLRDYS